MQAELEMPSSVETERLVLGSVLVGAEWSQIEHLELESFSVEKHRRIFGRMKDLAERGVGIDRWTLVEELKSAGQLESVDGLSYLVSLDDGLPEVFNLSDYVRILEEKRALRSVLYAAQAVIMRASSHGASSEVMLTELLRAVEQIGPLVPGKGIPTVGSIVETIGANAVLGGRERETIDTPWEELNKITGGLSLGDLVIIGARPSQGKTVMATQIATGAAITGKTAAFVSLEMSKESIIQRLVASSAGVPLYKLRGGWLDPVERTAARDALQRVTDLTGLLLADSCGTLAKMRAALLKIVAKQRIHVVAVDYLQLIHVPGSARRVEQITEISRGLKQLAVDLNCCMVVASQLSRESVKEEREPRLDDLRDSGSIEQDADVVIFPHRMPGQLLDERMVRTEFIVSKNRNGRLGRCPVVFEKPMVRFVEA